jgi:hypothetical protein
MAVGCAVVLCDHLGSGPLVRANEWAVLRRLNFGRRTCDQPLTVENLLAEIAQYDATEAAEVCRLARTHAGVEHTTDAFLALYGQVIREHAESPSDPEAESRAAAGFLARHLSYWCISRIGEVESERWKASATAALRGWVDLQKEYQNVREACDAAQQGWTEMQKEYQRVREACDAAHRGWTELQQEYERVLAECRQLQSLVNQPHAA